MFMEFIHVAVCSSSVFILIAEYIQLYYYIMMN